MRNAAISVLAAVSVAVGCGPRSVVIDPQSVVDLQVRPASGQLLYCPGDPFLVEVIAKLSDGTTCSSTDPTRDCTGKTNRIIDEDQIEMSATHADPDPKNEMVVIPALDPLITAGIGIDLHAVIVDKETGKQSMEANASLKPVYDCRLSSSWGGGIASGPVGAKGPDMVLTATSLSTPYYSDAVLVKVEVDGRTLYFISQSSDKLLSFVTRGQDGKTGDAGAPGEAGKNGEAKPQAAACELGNDGTNGTDGTDGKPGGDGGSGGAIKLRLDERVADKLKARIQVQSLGGAAGRGGVGGLGGAGGLGGLGGAADPDQCPDTRGKDGARGKNGANGPAGNPGANGPETVIEVASRQALFERELQAIEAIEAAPAKR